ncbi:response regulator [Bacillus sonorensis]|uniref:Two-component response regulator MalR n=2 Tax=Bacillus sonorensis TaxID=119858 RepID=M5P0I5_9BACI|nr:MULTISPECIES: response regulator [Bacillus]TWK75646.1 Transcriptional regulatory protein DcuR [Bacillus paralicheniformis]ASB90556.1 Chemotaxis response regulator protein-glutamate methylesterase [Bacillus sonorensis]EME72959.1 two-component response regulator MalR [Bacillus sonorensis L12]MBG9913975.1 transcriptional regulator [Bacillus sonorensis]MCF7616799.1 response regulator [Bacillus sonorensis]
MIDVLIVEDDPMVRELNKRYLSQVDGFRLKGIAASFQEAVSFLREHHVDLILLDIYMPGRNGVELLTEIRRQNQAVDVIVISAASEMDVVQKTLRFGAVDYLIKPFEFERFQTALTDYKRKQQIYASNRNISQKELDFELFQKRRTPEKVHLPKGLTKSTLKLIWSSIKSFDSLTFTTEDLANHTEISQVSIRKYLKFLEEIEVLNVEMAYGTIGRPVFQYKLNTNDMNVINQYL